MTDPLSIKRMKKARWPTERMVRTTFWAAVVDSGVALVFGLLMVFDFRPIMVLLVIVMFAAATLVWAGYAVLRAMADIKLLLDGDPDGSLGRS